MLREPLRSLLSAGGPVVPKPWAVVPLVRYPRQRPSAWPCVKLSKELRERTPQELHARTAVKFPSVGVIIRTALASSQKGNIRRAQLPADCVSVGKVIARPAESTSPISCSNHFVPLESWARYEAGPSTSSWPQDLADVEKVSARFATACKGWQSGPL
jgi:hypothetical protein